jgi:uronate dehydrogenase
VAKVFLTGCSGAVGRPVSRALAADGHEVRGFDAKESPELADFVLGRLEDAEAVFEAMASQDVVVHLAAQPHDVPFPELMGPNVLGLYHVLDAARRHGIQHVVLASSIQVVGRFGGSVLASTTETNPDNHYALTKLWAETMGRMYAHRFGMRVLAVRLAWMVRDVEEATKMAHSSRPDLYLSADDAGRFFRAAVARPVQGFEVVYAASREGEATFDMEPARRLIGYEAVDRWPEGLSFDFAPTPSGESGPGGGPAGQ